MSYTYKRKGEHSFTKDGHTMFHDDVLKDLERKEYLEVQFEQLQAQVKELEICQALTESNFNTFCDDKKHELQQLQKENEDLKERMSQVNDWLNSDNIFTDFAAISGFRALTKEDR